MNANKFTLLPNIKTSSSVTVSCVWQKNMIYNKSGFAGDCKNNLIVRKIRCSGCWRWCDEIYGHVDHVTANSKADILL